MRHLLSLTVLLLCCTPAAAAPAEAGAKTDAQTNSSAAATRPAVTGTIVIQVIQTSKEGTDTKGDAVTLELIGQGGSEAKPPTMRTRVDANGIAVFEKIPLSPPLTPRVIVDHGGRTFEATSDVMSVVDIERTMTVMVYDTTDQAPAWEIPMRYVQVQPSPHGILVITETFHVHNPADRAYLSAPDDKGVRSSVILPLPAGIKNVTFADGLRDNAKVVDGRIVSTAALRPGNSQFKVQYILPTETNPTTIEIVAPAPVGHLVVLVPRKGGVMLHAEGMKPGKVLYPDGKPWRSYIVSSLARDARTALVVDAPALAKAPAQEEGSRMPQILALVIGGIIVVVGAVMLMIRPRKRNSTTQT